MNTQATKVDGRTLRHQHRRDELLAAAVEYILDNGIAELSLRPMAESLGVTHATLIRQFESKEALIRDAVDSIRNSLFERRRDRAASNTPASLADALRSGWRRLCEPAERRQFTLLLELVAMQTRDPERFGSLAPHLVDDFLGPMTTAFRNAGRTPAEARDLATGLLAQVRGLQIDLALSGDRRRVDAAMDRYILMVTEPTDRLRTPSGRQRVRNRP